MEDNFFTVFSNLGESGRVQEVINNSRELVLPEKETLLNVDSPIRVVPFVMEGAIKVLREDREGRELYLYHIQPGESCAMTLSSTLSRENSQVKAVTLEKTRLLAVPVAEIHAWYRTDTKFREFVLRTYQRRFEELLKTLDQVAFLQVDSRLAQFLRDRSQALERTVLHITHQELAEELNSSREVISRLLKQMENKGMVELGRNRIKLIDLV